jgi:ankyrin repeat protein
VSYFIYNIERRKESLFEHIRNNNFQEVKKMIDDKSFNLNFKYGKKNHSPLICAIRKDNYKIVELLIEKGADFQSFKLNGCYPLNSATAWNRHRIAKLLIEKGAKINVVTHIDGEYKTPLKYAAINGNAKIVQLLIKKGANLQSVNNNNILNEVLFFILTNYKKLNNNTIPKDADYLQVISLLLENKANCNLSYKFSFPLNRACQINDLDIVRLLINSGANINKKSLHPPFFTPLDFAVKNNQKQIIDLLRKHGAKTSKELKAG